MSAKRKRKRRTRDEIVKSRASGMYYHMKRRLGDLPFDKAQLIDAVNTALDAGVCMYCGQKLTATKFSIDHMTPVCRGGSSGLDNLNAQVCLGCNRGKGRLTHDEYKDLMEFVHTLPQDAAAHIIGALKTGAALRLRAAYKRRRK